MALPKSNGKLPSQLKLELNQDLQEPEVVEKTPKASPKIVYLLLIATTLFSIAFWLYRDISKMVQNYSTFSPQIQLSLNLDSLKYIVQKLVKSGDNLKPNPLELDPDLTQILKNDYKNWGFYLEIYPTYSQKTLYWEKNKQLITAGDLSPLRQQLQALPPSENSFLKPSLPDGSQIRQIYTEENNTLHLQTLITLPTKEMLLIIQANSQINPTASRRHLPDLVHTIYWSFAGLD